MGFRFKKSAGNKFFRINFSKSGIGTSVGTNGMRFTQKAGGGTRSTISIPGTGISYVKECGSSGSKADQSCGCRTSNIGLSIVFKILGWLLIIPSLLVTLVSPALGLIGIGISILCFCAGKRNKKKGE